MESSLSTCETLVDDLCVLVDLQVLDGVSVALGNSGGRERSLENVFCEHD